MQTLKCDRCRKTTGTGKDWFHVAAVEMGDKHYDGGGYQTHNKPGLVELLGVVREDGRQAYDLHLCAGCWQMIARLVARSKFAPDVGEGPSIEVSADMVVKARHLCETMAAMPSTRTSRPEGWVYTIPEGHMREALDQASDLNRLVEKPTAPDGPQPEPKDDEDEGPEHADVAL